MIDLLHARAKPRAENLNIEALRAEIDCIDDILLDLIERRTATAAAIATLKAAEEPARLRLRPARERKVLDRITARAVKLPAPAVGAIWRELMGLSLQAQQRTEIVLGAPRPALAIADAARLRFGCQAPMLAAEGAEEALQRARTHQAIAMIELTPTSGWWTALSTADDLTIFDCLTDAGGGVTALLVGRLAPEADSGLPLFQAVTQACLSRRMASGEPIRALAMSGDLRLCIVERDHMRIEAVR